MPVHEWNKLFKITIGLIQPVVFRVWRDFLELKIANCFVPNMIDFFRGFGVVINYVVIQSEVIGSMATHKEIYRDAHPNLVIEYIAALPLPPVTTCASIPF